MGDLLVYNASAGSGKTYQLALEYIKLAIQGESDTSYRRILAVTFTNKATTEMKDRILIHLYNLAHGGLNKEFLDDLMKKLNPEDKKAEQQKTYTTEEVYKRAAVLLHNIIHDYDHFRIETIDSFFQSLLTNLAHELELTRNFRVDLNDKDVISAAVDRLLVSVDKSKSKVGHKGLLKQVLDYMEESIEDENGWNVSQNLKKFATKNLFNDTYLKNEEKLRLALGNHANIATLRSLVTDNEQAYIDAIHLAADKLCTFIENCAVKEKLAYINDSISRAKRVKNNDYLGDFSNRLQEQMNDSSRLLKKASKGDSESERCAAEVSKLLCGFRDALHAYNQTIVTAKLMLQYVSVVRLLSEIAKQTDDINKETGHFMLVKTPELFSRMVEKNDAPFVFERVGTTFDHIMIDEFQDTSRMQWDNFHKLLVENLSQGNQCMLVGDIKQSIYRWRGGDWQILDSIGNDSSFHSKKFIPLSVNWRSQKEIVDFNSLFFPEAAKLMDSVDNKNEHYSSEDKTRIAGIYKDVAQTPHEEGSGGYIRLAFSTLKSGKEATIEDLYAQMQRLHNEAKVPYRDMAILVRKNKEGSDIINYLAQYDSDFPINSDEAFCLTSSPAVMALVGALRYLDTTAEDKHTLLKLLHSLKSLALMKGEKCCDEQDMEALLAEAEALLPTELRDDLERQRLTSMPLYELCHKLISLLKLTGEDLQHSKGTPKADSPAAYDDCGQSAYLFTFLDGVLDFLNDNPSNISAFLEHWDTTLSASSTSGDSGDCVMVMTIHKSKGLSRHTVLIPFCDWVYNKFWDDDILWCTTPGLAPYNALPIAPIKPLCKQVDFTFYGADKASELLQQRIDNLNTLYVAFTRAKKNMLVWAYSKFATPSNSTKNRNESASTIGDILFQGTKGLVTTAPTPTYEFRPDSNEPSTSHCNNEEACEEYPFMVFERGKLIPEKESDKASQATTRKDDTKGTEKVQKNKPQSSNPLDDPILTPERIRISVADSAEVVFRQSNPAKDFLAATEQFELSAEADEEKAGLLQQSYIDRGKLMHRIFSQIRTAEDVTAALHDCELDGLLRSADEKLQIEKFITKRLQSPNIGTWFDGSWQLFNECSLLVREADGSLHTNRPDRVMAKGNEAIVVDFKFGRPLPQHHNQVSNYMHLLEGMGYTSVKGYLWYVYTDKVVSVLPH